MVGTRPIDCLDINLMRSVPEALSLLSVIAMLPAGADVVLLPRLVPSIGNLVLAKATPREATLINTDPQDYGWHA